MFKYFVNNNFKITDDNSFENHSDFEKVADYNHHINLDPLSKL